MKFTSIACAAGIAACAAMFMAAGPQFVPSKSPSATQEPAKTDEKPDAKKDEKKDEKKSDKKHDKDHPAAIGQAAPEFTLTGADGKTYNLSDYKGHTVVLEWFCPTCPVSGNGDGSFWGSGNAAKTLKAVKAADANVVYLTINSTKDGLNGETTAQQGAASTEIIAKGSAEFGSAVPVLMDPTGKVGRAYGAKTTPHIFIIDTTGNLVYSGAPASEDGKTDYILSAVNAIKEGKAVEPATTKSKGCRIKYASEK